MFKIEIDDSEFVREIDRIVDTAKLRDDLSDVLRRQFETAQVLVHQHTGDLKTSGRKSTSWNRVDKEWTGEISWSDPAATLEVHINEQRDPGKGHEDFWTSLQSPHWREEYLEAMHRHFRGDR